MKISFFMRYHSGMWKKLRVISTQPKFWKGVKSTGASSIDVNGDYFIPRRKGAVQGAGVAGSTTDNAFCMTARTCRIETSHPSVRR